VALRQSLLAIALLSDYHRGVRLSTSNRQERKVLSKEKGKRKGKKRLAGLLLLIHSFSSPSICVIAYSCGIEEKKKKGKRVFAQKGGERGGMY